MSDKDEKSRWDAVRKLFTAAKALPTDEQLSFVANECGGDERLREQVEALLQSSANYDAEIENIVQSVAADAVGDFSGHIGPYELIGPIGEGGMGRVFLAQHTDKPFKQQVAIKIVSGGVPTQQLLQRIRAERQILANLNHPNVARLLDGGETENGLPYLVMEYVDGVSLFDYCRQENLSLENRLRLFMTICDAVQHAHQNLIVHRDIKSSNIFVTGDGQPKLLDFGIAKLLRPEHVDYTVAVTVADARLLTPANASPEQISGGQITVSTDVYQLGLLLYELLTGSAPYDVEGLSPSALESVILDTTPTRPSDITTGRERSTLAGDLDTIVMKAVRKNPERRYASPRELADDIARHLNCEPVRARPDTRTYRVGKFLRRHTVAATAAATVGALIIAFAGTTYLQNQRIAEQRDIANRVSNFMVEIFDLAKPEASLGDTVTAEDILENGYGKIQEELQNEPGVKARLLWVMGESYGSLGSHENAVELLVESAELALAGNMNSIDTIEVLSSAGEQLSYIGRFSEADRYLGMAESRLSAMPDPSPKLMSKTLKQISTNLSRQDKLAEGLEVLMRAERIGREIEDDVDGIYANTLHHIGAWNMMLGRYEESERWLKQALSSDHPRYREPTISRAISLGVLGSVLDAQSRPEEALTTLQESLAILSNELGPDHINVGITHSTIGLTRLSMQQFDEAEVSFTSAKDILIASVGSDHYRVGTLYGYFANLERDRKNYGRALEYLEVSLAIKRKSLDPNHTSIATSLQKMAVIHRELGEHQQALQLLNEALAIYAESPANNTINEGQIYLALGSVQLDLDDLAAAERSITRARKIHTDIKNARGEASAAHVLGRIYLARNECARATAEFDQALAYFREQAPRHLDDVEEINAQRSECENKPSD